MSEHLEGGHGDRTGVSGHGRHEEWLPRCKCGWMGVPAPGYAQASQQYRQHADIVELRREVQVVRDLLRDLDRMVLALGRRLPPATTERKLPPTNKGVGP